MSDDLTRWLQRADTDPGTVAGVYDTWAESYDGDLADWGYEMPARVVEALAASRPGPGMILDVGCGTGLVGRELRTAGFESVAGIDLSPRSLEVAKATGHYAVLEQADLQTAPIPFDDGAIAGLVCAGVMTYLPDTARIVTEFCRVVRPGGPIAFSQRRDVYLERDDERVIGELAAAEVCSAVEISGPHSYLPGRDGLDDIPAMLVLLRSGAAPG